jgi:hypothetical protein
VDFGRWYLAIVKSVSKKCVSKLFFKWKINAISTVLMADDCDSEGGVTDSPKKGMKCSFIKC